MEPAPLTTGKARNSNLYIACLCIYDGKRRQLFISGEAVDINRATYELLGSQGIFNPNDLETTLGVMMRRIDRGPVLAMLPRFASYYAVQEFAAGLLDDLLKRKDTQWFHYDQGRRMPRDDIRRALSFITTQNL